MKKVIIKRKDNDAFVDGGLKVTLEGLEHIYRDKGWDCSRCFLLSRIVRAITAHGDLSLEIDLKKDRLGAVKEAVLYGGNVRFAVFAQIGNGLPKEVLVIMHKGPEIRFYLENPAVVEGEWLYGMSVDIGDKKEITLKSRFISLDSDINGAIAEAMEMWPSSPFEAGYDMFQERIS